MSNPTRAAVPGATRWRIEAGEEGEKRRWKLEGNAGTRGEEPGSERMGVGTDRRMGDERPHGEKGRGEGCRRCGQPGRIGAAGEERLAQRMEGAGGAGSGLAQEGGERGKVGFAPELALVDGEGGG